MPISAKYSWTQKKDQVKLRIPLKGVPVSKVDIVVSGHTLKVSFSPYILDIVLFHEVDSIKHKASVKDGTLTVTLFKKILEIWGELEAVGDKELLESTKKESLEALSVANEALLAKMKDRKIDDEKLALRKQMAIDEAERTRLENLKLEEKQAAEKEVYKTFAEMEQQQKNIPKKAENKVSFINNNISVDKTIFNIDPITEGQETIDDELNADDIDFEMEEEETPTLPKEMKEPLEENDFEDITEEMKFLPPPRSLGLSKTAGGKVDIKFTPRVFPTPMRESKASEEEDWIAKNRRHLKKHGVLGKNATGDISEEDPFWLKAKGDDFFRSGDIRSALNAYSAAIDADENMVPSYSNRAACYLQLELFDDCVLDCSQVLQKIESASEEIDEKGKVLILKTLMRRGSAYCQSGKFTESLMDFYQVLTKYEKLKPSSLSSLNGVTIDSIKADIQRLKLLNDCDRLKKEADLLFGNSSVSEAEKKYTEALTLLPFHVGCLSNRSACKLTKQDFQGCIDDCTAAIALLMDDLPISQNEKNAILPKTTQNLGMLSSILPKKGSEKRKSWQIKTILRRGVALAQIPGRLDDAVRDYSLAASLDPSNEALKSDLNKMINLREHKKISQQ